MPKKPPPYDNWPLTGIVRPGEAVRGYRDRLQEDSRDRAPLDWARTQYYLGAALRGLSELEGDTAPLEEATAAYREGLAALEEYSRERASLQWVRTQNNLGYALWRLGEREQSPERLREAAEVFSSVLQVDPDEQSAYADALYLYHDVLFAFPEAFDLSRAWLERDPYNLVARANSAEAALTSGEFTGAGEQLAALANHPELPREDMVPLRVLEICNLAALGDANTLQRKLDELGNLLMREELAVNWSFAGSRHFVEEHTILSGYPWLLQLLDATVEQNAAEARAAVENGRVS